MEHISQNIHQQERTSNNIDISYIDDDDINDSIAGSCSTHSRGKFFNYIYRFSYLFKFYYSNNKMTFEKIIIVPQ